MLERVGVPLRCAEMALEHDRTPAMQCARDWWETAQPTAFLLLLGGVGSGKSVAGAWVTFMACNGMYMRNPNVDSRLLRGEGMFIRAAEVSRSTMSDYESADRELFEELCDAKLLVLDDLGAERSWDGWLSRLDELLDRRYGDRRRTVITSNLDAAAFKLRYGARIADRIRHDGTVVSAGRDSLRRLVRP